MAATPGTTVTSKNPATNTNTSLTVTLASTTVGVLNVILFFGEAAGTAVNMTVTTPSGWTKEKEQFTAAGTPAVTSILFSRVFQSGDSSTVSVSWTNAGQAMAFSVPYTGFDTTTPLGTAGGANKSGSTGAWSASGTTSGTGCFCYAMMNRTGVAGGGASYSATTDNVLGNDSVTSSSVSGLAEYVTGSTATGTAFTKTATGPATSIGTYLWWTVNDAAGAFTGGSSLAATATVTAAGTVGASAYNGAAALAATASITAGGSVTSPAKQWVATRAGGTQYVAHRDGLWSTYGEETLEGYTAAAAYNSGLALEVSVWDTSDGVYVCSHDSTLTRVFGVSTTINSTTWASISPNGASTVGRPTTTVGGNPLRRLEEILDAFPSRIFVIENKHGTNQATLVTLLQAHAPGRWIFKGPYNDTANANTSSTVGAPIWLYWYPTDLANLSSSYTALATARSNGSPIIFGLGDYSTAPVPVQSDANTFFAFTSANGVYTWAHILGAASQKTTADGQATTSGHPFDGYMISNVANVIAGDGGGASLAATASITAAGVVGKSTGATLNAADTLTAAGIVGKSTGAALTGTATVTAAGAVGTSATSALSATAAITAAGTASSSSGASLTTTASITAAGIVGKPTSAALAATATLTAAGTAAKSSAATSTYTATITATGTVTVAGSGSATLPATATITVAGNVATAAAVTLTATTTIAASGTVTAAGTSSAAFTSTVGITATGTVASSRAATQALTVNISAAGTLVGPARDITVTVSTGYDRWNVTTGTDRWQITPGRDRWAVTTQEAP